MKGWILSRPARLDLDDIWLYIAKNSGSVTADRFVARITDAIPILASFPGMGRPADAVRKRSRAFPVGGYILYYRVTSGKILIQRIIHGRREQRRG